METALKNKSAAHEIGQVLKHGTTFSIEARRNKLLGLWAAENMGLTGDAAKSYAVQVIHSDLEEVGIEDVVRKVAGDFAKNNVNIDEDTVRGKIDEFQEIARAQMSENP